MPRPEARRDRVILSVSELTRDVKLNLESSFYNLWVTGEVSNLKQPSAGHLYFTLKDDRSQLSAVMFRSARRNLKFRPADGMAVLVRGHLTVYEPRGAYQIQVEAMEPRGKGALQIAFEQLKEKLAKEGLFDDSRKQPLPLLPQRLGIVTSPSGAALRDLCHILHRRFPNLEVIVYPARVQGGLAAADIAKGVQVLNRLGGFDVIIVGRGGGSLEDLWPFNEESVARAIAASKIPVVSAVGHEVDFTIADFVADVRAPTPSAAAEIVVTRKEDFEERVKNLAARIDTSLRHQLERQRSRVEQLTEHRAFAAVRHSVELRAQRLDEMALRSEAGVRRGVMSGRRRLDDAARRLEACRPDRKLGEAKSELTGLGARLAAAISAARESKRSALAARGAKLEALSPLAVLGRGYSLTWSAQGKLLRDAGEASPGDALKVTLHKGALDCRVEGVDPGGDSAE